MMWLHVGILRALDLGLVLFLLSLAAFFPFPAQPRPKRPAPEAKSDAEPKGCSTSPPVRRFFVLGMAETAALPVDYSTTVAYVAVSTADAGKVLREGYKVNQRPWCIGVSERWEATLLVVFKRKHRDTPKEIVLRL